MVVSACTIILSENAVTRDRLCSILVIGLRARGYRSVVFWFGYRGGEGRGDHTFEHFLLTFKFYRRLHHLSLIALRHHPTLENICLSSH